MKKEQKTRQVKEGEHARNWMLNRFGVEETPRSVPTFEQRLAEFDNDPRVMATEATMRVEGFTMEPNAQYRV